jgi:filamentous hemagglutinin family protein
LRILGLILLTGVWGTGLANPPMLPTFTTCYTTGAATCTYSDPVDGVDTQLTITQTSDILIGAWDSFVIGTGATVHFEQPEGGGALIRIPAGVGVSEFKGTFSATSRVYLISPDGFIFDGAQLQGQLGASTYDWSDAQAGVEAPFIGAGPGAGSGTGPITIGAGGLSGPASGKIILMTGPTIPVSVIGPVDVAQFAWEAGCGRRT